MIVAYDPLPGYLGEPNVQAAIIHRLKQSEDIYIGAIEQIGIVPNTVHKEILEGPPTEAILAMADAREVDLIIMGTRGLGRLAGTLLGSQSQKVVGHAKCPVLLVQ